jgi:hypothetical protein
MSQRLLAIVAIVAALGLAVFSFTRQQQSAQEVAAASTRERIAEISRVTAVALAQEAIQTQAAAEADRATAVLDAAVAQDAAAAAALAATNARATSVVVQTAGAISVSTSQADVESAQATTTAQADVYATAIAGATEAASTAQDRLESAATSIVDLSINLGTATAQVDTLIFAFNAAAEDRATAVSGLLAAQTQVSGLDSDLATAQVQAGLRPSGTPPPAVTATPSPAAATPRPTATPEPAASASLDLSQTFTTAGGARFNYPAGWQARESRNGIFLASNDRAADPEAEYQSGDYVVLLFVLNGEQLTGQSGLGVLDMAQVVAQAFGSGDNPLVFGEISRTRVGELVIAEARTEGGPVASLMLVADYGNDVFVAALANSISEEADILNGVTEQILASFEF